MSGHQPLLKSFASLGGKNSFTHCIYPLALLMPVGSVSFLFVCFKCPRSISVEIVPQRLGTIYELVSTSVVTMPRYLLCHHRLGTDFPVSISFSRTPPTGQGRLICSLQSNIILHSSWVPLESLCSVRGRMLLLSFLPAGFLPGA